MMCTSGKNDWKTKADLFCKDVEQLAQLKSDSL